MQKFNYTKITSTDLILEVNLNMLTKEEQVLMFGNNYTLETRMENTSFVQDEDVIFEMNLMLYLELNPTYCLLKKGMYPLRFKDEKVQVLLSLSPSE